MGRRSLEREHDHKNISVRPMIYTRNPSIVYKIAKRTRYPAERIAIVTSDPKEQEIMNARRVGACSLRVIKAYQYEKIMSHGLRTIYEISS